MLTDAVNIKIVIVHVSETLYGYWIMLGWENEV